MDGRRLGPMEDALGYVGQEEGNGHPQRGPLRVDRCSRNSPGCGPPSV